MLFHLSAFLSFFSNFLAPFGLFSQQCGDMFHVQTMQEQKALLWLCAFVKILQMTSATLATQRTESAVCFHSLTEAWITMSAQRKILGENGVL